MKRRSFHKPQKNKSIEKIARFKQQQKQNHEVCYRDCHSFGRCFGASRYRCWAPWHFQEEEESNVALPEQDHKWEALQVQDHKTSFKSFSMLKFAYSLVDFIEQKDYFAF